MRLCAPRVAVESIPCRGELCTLTLMLRSSVSGAPSGDMNHLSRAGIRVGTNVGIGAVSELVPGMEAKVRWGAHRLHVDDGVHPLLEGRIGSRQHRRAQDIRVLHLAEPHLCGAPHE